MNRGQSGYAIGEVAVITGINPITLRAWQRRYGILQPERNEQGHRLYSEADIATIKTILSWLERGLSIGQVKGLLHQPTPLPMESHWNEVLLRLDSAAMQLAPARIESEINELSVTYPLPILYQQLLRPWLTQLQQDRREGAELRFNLVEWLLEQHFGHYLLAQNGKIPLRLVGLGVLPPLKLTTSALLLAQAGFRVTRLVARYPHDLNALATMDAPKTLLLLGAGVAGNLEALNSFAHLNGLDTTDNAYQSLDEWQKEQ